MALVANESGKVIVLACGFDLTGYTALDLTIKRPNGTSFTKDQASGLAVGATDLTVGNVTYLANQYITYTTGATDLPVAGWYKRKLAVTFPAKKLITVEEVFEVAA